MTSSINGNHKSPTSVATSSRSTPAIPEGTVSVKFTGDITRETFLVEMNSPDGHAQRFLIPNELCSQKSAQRSGQFSAQIIHILDSHRKPHQPVAYPQSLAIRQRDGSVRHDRWVLDQAFDAAERFC